MRKKSTGPKTVAGKMRSAQNARRRGLTVPAVRRPEWALPKRSQAGAGFGKTNPTQSRTLCQNKPKRAS